MISGVNFTHITHNISIKGGNKHEQKNHKRTCGYDSRSCRSSSSRKCGSRRV